MRYVATLLSALWLWNAALAAPTAGAREGPSLRVHHRENVLGTSFEMVIVGIDDKSQDAVVAATLTEIQRLEKLLSSWQPESELSRVNVAASAVDVSAELAEVLALCEDWRRRTGSAFSCRIGELIRQWRALEGKSDLPDRTALRKLARTLDRLDITVRQDDFVRPPTLRWDIDGVAKGYVLDKALSVARRQAPRASGIGIDIGGDAIYFGHAPEGKPWRIAVADPRGPRDNTGFLAKLELPEGAGIASSGHRSRGVRVANRHFSHVLDPREGWPAEFAPAATVVAKDAATADALATALSVLPIRKGLDLIERIPDAEALLVSETGKTFASSGWYGLLVPEERHDPPWSPGFEFVVDYEIPQRDATNYRRPYLAIWIAEKGSGAPLRQLLCWATPSAGCRKCEPGGAEPGASTNPPYTASCAPHVAPETTPWHGTGVTSVGTECLRASISFALKRLANTASANFWSCRCAWVAKASRCGTVEPRRWVASKCASLRRHPHPSPCNATKQHSVKEKPPVL